MSSLAVRQSPGATAPIFSPRPSCRRRLSHRQFATPRPHAALRLVGVETNPGPVGPLVAASAIAPLLLSFLRKSKKKKQAKGTRSSIPNTRKRVRASKRGNQPSPVLRMTSAPASRGSVVRQSTLQPTSRVPFSSVMGLVYTDLAGRPFIGNNISAGSNRIDLSPNWGGVGINNIFGVAVSNIAKSFARFRLDSLRWKYIPMVSTTTPGVVGFGYIPDAGLNSTSPDFYTVTSMSENVTTSAWQTAELPMRGLLHNRGYTHISGTDPSSERMDSSGTVFIGGLGLPPNLSVGYIHVEGVISFDGIGYIENLVSPAAPSVAVESSVSVVSATPNLVGSGRYVYVSDEPPSRQ